ncbi:MAG: hypothetical protein ACJ72D_23785 [Marmoricola sp.]
MSDDEPESETSQDTRDWLAQWVPTGAGQIVVGGMNLEFSGSAENRPKVFPRRNLDSMPRVRDYIALLDFVARSGSPESLESDLAADGELARLSRQILDDRASNG